MKNEVINMLKMEHQKMEFSTHDIPDLTNKDCLKDDNMKYMKMYNWLSGCYDFIENVVGKLIYGNQIIEMRQEMMNKLEWKDNLSVLCVSTGTGRDLEFIPQNIDLKSLTICGIDISLGMMRKCKKKFNEKTNWSLFHCCAEDLPFQDNTFDMVFHVGGINFFSDRQKAVDEMIRVAQANSKLLIADETNDLLEKRYKKSCFTKKYFDDKVIDLNEMEKLIPSTVKERQTDILWGGKFYCISFRK
jgi:ubiquinone/menaquinone biosynthesis C-methylase UbiE